MMRTFNRLVGPQALAIVDEVVECVRERAIGGTTYYAGSVYELAYPSVLGNDSATYGAWTAAEKAGTRYLVKADGLPGANEVLWDAASGELITSVSVTLYVRYQGAGRVLQAWELGPLAVRALGDMNATGTREVARVRMFGKTRLAGVTIAASNVAAAALAFSVGGQTVTLAQGQQSVSSELGMPIALGASDSLVVTVPSNSANVSDPVILLIPG
jgi:hypothetical protein